MQVYLDIIVCVLWMATYTFVLIGTIVYKYPLISPLTQAIIAPYEFAFFLWYILQTGFQLNHVSIAYHYWTVIEVVIFIAILKTGIVKKRSIGLYLLFVILMSIAMYDLVTIRLNMLFFSHVNTFLGTLVWLKFICNKEYPMKLHSLCAFISKFVANVIAVPVYVGMGNFIDKFICIALPILDFLFIWIYFKRKKEATALSAEDFS